MLWSSLVYTRIESWLSNTLKGACKTDALGMGQNGQLQQQRELKVGKTKSDKDLEHN